jgi:hypothetical protein
VLLDPELGSNPSRSSSAAGKKAADAHAEKLVRLFAETKNLEWLGLSTFGSGWRMKWFPLLAFTKALAKEFGGHTFIGGQTYTDDGAIDMSIADMQKTIVKAGGVIANPALGGFRPSDAVEVVPNFGLYKWNTGKRKAGSKAVRKTPEELRLHLYEFVNEKEPVDALIGWAENFADTKLWNELARFADVMARGACKI